MISLHHIFVLLLPEAQSQENGRGRSEDLIQNYFLRSKTFAHPLADAPVLYDSEVRNVNNFT